MRPLKRWRYVAVFGDGLMACAALVQIGPARQSFWALHLRGEAAMDLADRERTRLLPRRARSSSLPARLAATPARLCRDGCGCTTAAWSSS